MKSLKYYLILLSIGFFCSPLAHALNYVMQPNQIPQAIVFNLAQSNGRHATINFPGSMIPITVLCYFGTTNGGQPKQITATFSSQQDNLDFSSDGDETLNSDTGNTKMFVVKSSKNQAKQGQININLTGNDPRLKTITMICTMRK